jgi:hypothetical protein
LIASHSCNNITSNHHQLCIPTPATADIAGTGCTGHFLKVQSPCTHCQPATNGIHIQLPNKARIQAAHTYLIDIPSLPPSARQAHIFPQLAHALISIGLLYNHCCRAIFDSHKVEIWHPDAVILHGHRDPRNNLWTLPLQASIDPQSALLCQPTQRDRPTSHVKSCHPQKIASIRYQAFQHITPTAQITRHHNRSSSSSSMPPVIALCKHQYSILMC